MVSISNVDLVMAALRARLQAVSKEKRTGKTAKTALVDSGELQGPVQAPSLAELPPRKFDRELVRVLLEREFGGGIAEDPRFQAVVERTCSLLKSDPETEALFRQVQREQT